MGCKSSSVQHTKSDASRKSTKSHTKGFHDNYVLGKKLGRGGFGQVHVASQIIGGQVTEDGTRAVKIMDMRLASPKVAKLIHAEVAHWKMVGHSHNMYCVHLYGVFYGNDLCYMIMERCAGTLHWYLERCTVLDEIVYGGVFVQMLFALKYIHAHLLVHRDVKPDNFFIGGEDYSTIKLGDFGFSALLPESGKLKGECGTAPFMAPEMVQHVEHDEKVDIWSLGVLVYALLFGRFPYKPEEKTSSAMKRAIANALEDAISFRSSVPLSSGAVAFAMSLLVRSPSHRPSAEDALSMAYMVGVQERSRSQQHPDLPCLRHVFKHAKRIHAFELRDAAEKGEIDDLLNKLQMEHLGVPLPQCAATERPRRDWVSQHSASRKKSTGTSSKFGGTGSDNFHGVNSSRATHSFQSDGGVGRKVSVEEASTVSGSSDDNDASSTCSL